MVCQPIYCIGVIPIEKEGKNTTKKHGTFNHHSEVVYH
jgi:hypothetical protein